MMIVLYDPSRLLARLQIIAWFRNTFKRVPQTVHETGPWWHIGPVDPAKGLVVAPPLPELDATRPYSDPPYHAGTTLFEAISKTRYFDTFLPIVRKG